ncbi:MAG: hypothetical protein MHM6MM_009551 [Cercozoa sp. M6MM]
MKFGGQIHAPEWLEATCVSNDGAAHWRIEGQDCTVVSSELASTSAVIIALSALLAVMLAVVLSLCVRHGYFYRKKGDRINEETLVGVSDSDSDTHSGVEVVGARDTANKCLQQPLLSSSDL